MKRKVKFLAVVGGAAYFFEKKRKRVLAINIDQSCIELLVSASKNKVFILAKKLIEHNSKQKVALIIKSKVKRNQYETYVEITQGIRKKKVASTLNESLPLFTSHDNDIYVQETLLKEKGVRVSKKILREALSTNI